MKKLYLYLFCFVIVLAGCSKKSDSPKPEEEEPKGDFLIQKVENENLRFSFTYNDQDQLTLIEQQNKPADSYIPYKRYTVSYENGLPATAEIYQYVNGSLPYAWKRIKFKIENNKIAYAAFVTLNKQGEIESFSEDTVRVLFNDQNRLIELKTNGEKKYYGYDDARNIQMPYSTLEWTGNKITYTNEHTYDKTINPYRYKQLGLYMTILGITELESEEQLLSLNNSIKFKADEKAEQFNNGALLKTELKSSTITRTIEFDEQGGLKNVTKIISNSSQVDNGGITMRNEILHFKYICVKR